MTADEPSPGEAGAVSLLVRPLQADDIEAVLAMMRGYYADDDYPFDEADSRDALRGFLGDPAVGRMWVFDAGGDPVGYFALTLGYSLEYRGRDGFLDELFLRRDFRGKGLGAQALSTVIEAGRELGVRALHLEVERDRPKVIDLYRRNGFVDNNRCLMTLRLDEPRADVRGVDS